MFTPQKATCNKTSSHEKIQTNKNIHIAVVRGYFSVAE